VNPHQVKLRRPGGLVTEAALVALNYLVPHEALFLVGQAASWQVAPLLVHTRRAQ